MICLLDSELLFSTTYFSTYMYFILVLSIWGYVDLRTTLNAFDDKSEKITTQKDIQSRPTSDKLALAKINFISSKYSDMDCFEIAKSHIQSTMFQQFDKEGLKDSELKEKIVAESRRCQNAKNIIFEINDTLMLLVVLAACALNMIFQSGLAVFHGM